MPYQHIKFAIENGIASLVLARHDVRNAISDTTFVNEIVDAVSRAQVSTEARVLVLSAEGSAFSAGGNVKHMRDKTGTFAGGPATVRRRYMERRQPAAGCAMYQNGVGVDPAIVDAAVDQGAAGVLNIAKDIDASGDRCRHTRQAVPVIAFSTAMTR